MNFEKVPFVVCACDVFDRPGSWRVSAYFERSFFKTRVNSASRIAFYRPDGGHVRGARKTTMTTNDHGRPIEIENNRPVVVASRLPRSQT
jgi:hypothetical protein